MSIYYNTSKSRHSQSEQALRGVSNCCRQHLRVQCIQAMHFKTPQMPWCPCDVWFKLNIRPLCMQLQPLVWRCTTWGNTIRNTIAIRTARHGGHARGISSLIQLADGCRLSSGGYGGPGTGTIGSTISASWHNIPHKAFCRGYSIKEKGKVE